MRVPLLPLTGRAVYNPIETIIFFFIIVTLAYFRVLSAIKHSVFFAPAFPSTLSTSHALLRDGQWVAVDEEWYLKRESNPHTQGLELQQLVFSTAKAVDPVRI
jgi:hydroxymethylglutaryl-CoA reductase (NADPH)